VRAGASGTEHGCLASEELDPPSRIALLTPRTTVTVTLTRAARRSDAEHELGEAAVQRLGWRAILKALRCQRTSSRRATRVEPVR
jgi:hypothetical protein